MGSQAIEGIPSGPRSRTTGLHDQQSFRVRVQNVFNVAVAGPRQAALARNMSSLNSHTAQECLPRRQGGLHMDMEAARATSSRYWIS